MSALNLLQVRFLEITARLNKKARQVEVIAILLDAWGAYGRHEMGTLAAALAYYFLLAIFPLLLLLIALASPFLSDEQIIRQATRFVGNYLPTVAPELRGILRQVVLARGPVSVLAALGLLWTSSGVFDLVQRGLNRAWHVLQPRPLWRQRVVSLATVIGVGLLFGFSFVASLASGSGIRLNVELGGRPIELIGLLFSTALNFVLFAVVYKFFPFAKVTWRQVWAGALLASVTWEAAKFLFVWYLLNFARLSLVYGSVGAVIALLVWGYITATILLFGAELTARDAQTPLAAAA